MEETGVRSAYEKWVAEEGVPIIDVPAGTDLLAITEHYPWDRIGARAIFLNQPVSMRGQVGAFLLEIPLKTSTKPIHHMYDEFLYILRGHGKIQVWIAEDNKVTADWQTHDLLAIPLNAWFQITNLGEEPAKILSVNSGPIIINYFNNTDFVFHSDYVFGDRFSSQEEYYKNFKEWYSEEGQEAGWVYEASYFRDVYNRPWPPKPSVKGKGGHGVTGVNLITTQGALAAASSERAPGTYPRAHKHIIPGWFGITLKGSGLTINWTGDTHLWSKASGKNMYYSHEGTVFAHPDPWWHQHFNTGDIPYRGMAFVYGAGPKRPVWRGTGRDDLSVAQGGDRILYSEEDPEILRLFIEELKKVGRKPRPLDEWRRDD